MQRHAALMTAVTAAAALATASPAAAKAVKYAGKTNAGDRITFTLSGGKVSQVRSATPTTCVPLHGTPRAGTDVYLPGGRFALGTTTKVQSPGPVETALHYNKVTKWFHFTAVRSKRATISGRLSQNFSFNSLDYSSGSIRLMPWLCQGDARFSARAR